jgi:hypothetical protein
VQQHRPFSAQRAVDVDHGDAIDASQLVGQHVFGQA